MPTTQPCPKCKSEVPAGSRFCQVCGSSVADAAKKKGKSGSGSQTKFFVMGAVAIILVVAAVLAGLGSSSAGKTQSGSVAEVPGAGPIPDWLKNADPDIIADYAWAAQHYEELRNIPCYCGCGSVGHTSNATCYYRYDKNGKILGWDAHALG